MSSIIDIKHLTKKYGSFSAVDDVSFSVEKGETFGILGPNGAGKTTTLEIIEGLRKPTSGTVTLDGKDVEKETHAVKAVIGVQLQASTFFEGLNLVELIETFAALYDRKVNPMELLQEVQLAEKAKSQVKELSGGQKQRLSIAIGLVNDPKVLFLDEPTTGLDPQARRNLWDLVMEIKKKGKTVVLTTHYMDEAEVLCDRIAVMDHAKIIALDTTEKLLTSTGVLPRIQFESPTQISDEQLKKLSGVENVERKNMTYFLTTSNSQKTLDELFALGAKGEIKINELTVKRATLEDVFLKLTGRGLRD
jgi:ABC-2 type transport system ATP-binding protein